MNILIIILTSLAAFIAFLLIAALFIKKDFAIYREIIIDKPVEEVFNYVKFLKNQDYYSKWVMTDPAMKKIFRGTDGTVGFVYGWDGNKKAGEGEEEITGMIENEQIDIEVRFKRPMVSVANTPIKLERAGSQATKVIWGMNSVSKYPLNLMTFLMSGVLGKDIEISLGNLKKILEKK